MFARIQNVQELREKVEFRLFCTRGVKGAVLGIRLSVVIGDASID